MEILKKLKKRICPFVLAVVIFVTSVVSGPMSLTARAASFSVTADTTVEFVMMLYNIFETVSIASGIKDGLDNYESGMSLFEAFISFLDGLTYDPFEAFDIIGPDGQALTRDDVDSLLEAAMSNGKLKVKPDEKSFAKYRIIDGTSSPSQSPDPSSSPDPDDKYVNPFTDLQGMFVGANLIAASADFLSSVQNNAVPKIDPVEYYASGFNGELEQDADGNYIVTGKITSFYDEDYIAYYFLDDKHISPVLGIYGSSVSGKTWGTVTFYVFQFGGTLGSSNRVKCVKEFYKSGVLSSSSNLNYTNYSSGTTNRDLLLELNIPIFNSITAANQFIKNGSTDGLLNNIPYDYHSMTAAAPDTLERLPGTKLDPNNIPALNDARKKAANGVEATDADKDANNAKMIAAVKTAVAEALAEAQPDPSPTTAPDPEPSVAPDPGTDTDYTGILGLILAAIKAIASSVWDFFSNPMSIITNGITSILELFPQVNTLIQALPAAVFGFFQDPLGAITSGISNLYNGVLRIIEIFPEQVQLVLGNIASLPDALLQVFADPLGAIQSLLGLLPSWANLQAYLDKILQALLDPVSVVLPSDPGGTDPGGDGSGGDGSKFNLSSLFNGLIYLILILILLLKIFIHCLQFIINIFKIEPTQGFLPDDMVTGMNFLKQLQIEGIGLSVYDFMMGLVYILMFFGVVKLLRGYVYKIRIPSGGK